MIDHVDFRPTYTFPSAIAARYILPLLQAKPETVDPSLVIYADAALGASRSVDWKSFSESNFPFQVTQTSGASNVLGEFRMPLKDDATVSIHGRPNPDPKLPVPKSVWPACVALAGSADSVANLLDTAGVVRPPPPEPPNSAQRIDLKSAIPVIFLYATVWQDTGAGVVFGPDPLGLDAPLFRKLTPTPSS
jgi:murein L,D-transpeptidase YcbB/YkuD